MTTQAKSLEIKLANGTYHTANFRFRAMSKLAGDNHKARWSQDAAAFVYDRNATCPVWDDLLGKCMSRSSAAILQRWFGLILSGDMSFQRCVVLSGCRLARRSVAILMEEFFASFGVKDLIGYRFSQCALGIRRARSVPRVMLMDGWSNSRRAQEYILSVIGEDRQSIAVRGGVLPLYMPMYFTFFVDDLPSDRWRLRSLDIQLRPIDELYADCWENELSGIFNWAMQGLSQLRLKQWETES